jgi:hypothetical protein
MNLWLRKLFGNDILAAFVSGGIYDVIHPNGDFGFSKQSPLSKRNAVTEPSMEKDPPSDNAVQRSLKQFQETGNVVHRNGTGRPSTSRTLGGKLSTAWTPYVPRNSYTASAGEHLEGNWVLLGHFMPRKARMLKLFSILQHWFCK